MVQQDAKTKLFILLGNPVAHSLSPAIHNAAFSFLHLNSVYLACPVESNRLGAALEGMKALSAAGANVTSPHKEAVIPFLDSVSPEAGQIRSVNTVLNREGQLYGTSTDGEGLYKSLQETAPGYETGQNIMVVGAGGAARAAAYTLARRGAGEMHIVNRNLQAGRDLSAMLTEDTPVQRSTYLPLQKEDIKKALGSCRLFIYSLPLDEREFTAALDEVDFADQERLLVDLRYSPGRSAVMAAFEEKGGRAVDGLGMLLGQAMLSFELFTGQKAPGEVMRKAAVF